MSCDNVITVQDLETDKKHSTFYREVITGKAGGTGDDIDSATNAITGQTQATLPKVLSNVGFSPAGFDFTTGGTLTERDKAIFYQADGNWYSWGGNLPKVVPPASSPASTGGIADNAWNVSTSAFMYRDWEGFTAELLAQAGIVDDGQPDSLGSSKRVDSILGLIEKNAAAKSLSKSQYALTSSMTPSEQTSKVQSFIDSVQSGCLAIIDQNALIDDVGVYAKSGVHIIFANQAEWQKHPTASDGYGMLWLDGVKDCNIYNPKLIGDKYSHLANSGEFGIGLRIVGACDNVNIYSPICNEMWGDGIYIGANGSEYPTGKGVSIHQPLCDRNRRQGISYIGGVVRIYDPELSNTKSSDSRFTLSAGPHAGIDIEPNNNDPVIDVVVTNPRTANNDGEGVLITPFFVTDAHELKIKISNHIDYGSKHAVRLLANNSQYTGYIHYDGYGENNNLNAIYIDAWTINANCEVHFKMRAKKWGRGSSSTKFGAAYAWGSTATTNGGIKLDLKCYDTLDKAYITNHLGPKDCEINVTYDLPSGVCLLSSESSKIDVKCNGPLRKEMTATNMAYTDYANEFFIAGSGGSRSLGFESSWFPNMRDGDMIDVFATNTASLLIQTTASQASSGGSLIRKDGTAGNYTITSGASKFIAMKFMKRGFNMHLLDFSGGTGANA